MIDQKLLFEQLKKVEKIFFVTHEHERAHARVLWKTCVEENLAHAVLSAHSDTQLVRWVEQLGTRCKIDRINQYHIIAVDGSQIYPDRHEGIRVALINIGGIFLSYGVDSSHVCFFSEPEILNPHERESQVPAFVDCVRHERELAYGLEQVKIYSVNNNMPLLLLFDGSLIFWHLEQVPALREQFIARYCAVIQELYNRDVLCAWYTSLPHSRDLVHIMRAYAQYKKQDGDMSVVCDSDILENVLGSYERTSVFESVGTIVQNYPAFMRPYFFYMQSGVEIVRVEIPSWCARDTQKVDLIARMIIDQCIKGDGYPVSCAHAHAQAVVGGRDRLLFQQAIYAAARTYQVPIMRSRKLMKKQALGI